MHTDKAVSPTGSNTHSSNALLPLPQLLITESSWRSALGQFQKKSRVPARGRGGAGCVQVPAACTLLLVAPQHRTRSLPSTRLLPRDLLDGSEVLMYGHGFSSKIQFCLQTLSAALPKLYPPFVLLPPTAGSAPLSQMRAPQYSSQAALSSALPQHKEQRDRAQKAALLSSSTTALGKTTHRIGLACSITAVVLDVRA